MKAGAPWLEDSVTKPDMLRWLNWADLGDHAHRDEDLWFDCAGQGSKFSVVGQLHRPAV